MHLYKIYSGLIEDLVKLIEVICASQKQIVTNQGTLLRPQLWITVHACLFSASLVPFDLVYLYHV